MFAKSPIVVFGSIKVDMFKSVCSQIDVDSLRQRTQEIIKENEHLHLRLEQSGAGPADITEW